MTLAWPWALLLLGLVPVFAALAGATGWRHRARLRALLSEVMLERVLPRSARRRRALRDLLTLGGLALAVVALAEPRFDQTLTHVKAKGTDLVLLLDLSRSMDARDVDPSRLGRARREIEDLGQLLEGDRVGLVVFAGGAFPRLPLTNDYKAVQLVVSEADTDTFDTQGSNLGAAIDAGLELLKRSEGEAGRALLVLSDGETHDADHALQSAKAASDAGVAIYAMGIGSAEAPIPMRDGSFLQYQGKVVTTSPDFEVLKQVAKETGGAFVTSTASTRDMEGLYAALRQTVHAVDRDLQQRQSFESAYQWPLAAAAFAWLGAAWLGDGRRRFGAAVAVLLAVSLAASSTAHAADDALVQADALYRAGKYADAAQKLVELSLERPDDADVLDRLGAARYRAGDFEGAARAWDQASRSGDEEATFNAGNAHYQAGRLEEAVKRYDQVLAQDPKNEAAAHNKEVVSKEIEARRAQKPPPPPQPKEGQKQGEQGQQQPKQGQPQPQPQQPQGDGQQQPQPQPGDDQQPQPQQPQPGQGSDQQQPSGQPQQQPQPGEPQDPQQQPQGSPDQPDQQPPAPDQPVDPSSLDPQQGDNQDPKGPGAAQGGSSQGEEQGPITASQADRLLDSVEEGAPRTVVQGRPEEKPW